MSVAEKVQTAVSDPAFPQLLDPALSTAAQELRSILCDGSKSDPAQYSESRVADAILQDILLAMTPAESGQSRAVDAEAFERAVCLARVLPRNTPLPDVIIEDDGEIAFDWQTDPRRILSVSIGAGPMLSYAALLGPEPTHGRVAFAGSLPAMLAFLLGRMSAGIPANHA